MSIIDLAELKIKLDKVACKHRLYPTRLLALQTLTSKKLDMLIDRKIVQPLLKLTAFKGHKIKYRFTSDTLYPPNSDATVGTWGHHFINDFANFGLREAILYFHTYKFLGDATGFIEQAIAVYQ